MEEEIEYDDLKFQRFNESLDESGAYNIGGIDFWPSRILYEMEIEVYKEAWKDFEDAEFEKLKDTIYNQYPSCIAYNYRLSEKGEGASDPVRKLLHLKDTWESIVFVLYAIVWGEIRFKSIDLKAAQIIIATELNGNPIFKNFNTDRLITDALRTKILNIKAVIHYSKANNLGLKSENIELGLLDKLLELQDIRNDISHHTTPTNDEAEAELKLVIPLFEKMLVLTEFLKDCKILRFESFSTKCRCEEFNGHYLNKEFDDYDFDVNQAYVLGLGKEQLFINWEDEVFSLSPFLHYHKDGVGRESYLSVFKGKKDGKYRFEPITKRDEVTFDLLQARFDLEQAKIINLIVP
ncbi:MAG: hypothetical protein Q8904_09930 [Bacteroidota bacterium]|nr:hypothetical protein [Bacteroidota bacterium]